MEQFDAVISYSDSGVVTMRLEAGHLTKEEGEQGGQLFDQGVKVTLLNNDGSIRGGILEAQFDKSVKAKHGSCQAMFT